jgi:hypothetical protein
MKPKQYELYFLDVSDPSNKSRLEYKYQLGFVNNPDYSVRQYHEINNLNLGESCNLSYGTVKHWIRRIN